LKKNATVDGANEGAYKAVESVIGNVKENKMPGVPETTKEVVKLFKDVAIDGVKAQTDKAVDKLNDKPKTQ
jgi:hypothetical protein